MVVVAVAWQRDLRPDGTAQRPARRARARLAHPRLAGRLHLRAARRRSGRHVVRDRAGHGAAAGRDEPIPGSCTRRRGSTAPGPSGSSSRSRCPSVRGEIAVALTLTIDRRAAHLRPGLHHHARRSRRLDLGAVVRGLPPGVRAQPDRLGGGDRRHPDHRHLRDLVRDQPLRGQGGRVISRGERLANYVILSAFAAFALFPIAVDPVRRARPRRQRRRHRAGAQRGGAALGQLRGGVGDRAFRHLPDQQPDRCRRSSWSSRRCCRSWPGTPSARCTSAGSRCCSTCSCSGS